MHWLGVVFFVLAGAVIFRWYGDRFDRLGRERSFPWISSGLLVLIGIGLWVPWFLRRQLESELSEATSKLLGERVEVNCQSFGQAFVDVGAEFGYVAFGADGVPEKETLIKRDQCRHLRDYLNSEKDSPTLDEVIAVHTLSHEAMHMAGETSERRTECLAVQRDAEMAEELGASPDEALALAETYWTTVFPNMPDDYRSEDCPGPSSSGG